MAENSAYFNAIVAHRSQMLSEDEALAGCTTVSLETQADMAESDVLSYIENHFTDFLRYSRFLSPEDQELLYCYYILAKTQTTLAPLHRSTQTLCSARIRKAMMKLGGFILLGLPTPDIMKPIFEANGLENLLSHPLSEVVDLYARTRSFQRVAEVLSLHRPEIRRVMSLATKALGNGKGRQEQALGAYLFDLIDKASATGKGWSKRKLAKQGDIYRCDPHILGEFRIDITSPDFAHIFVSRANR